MAKAAAKKLKVYRATFGFDDSVVAAPNQAAALLAWGTHQDLFAGGGAVVTTEPAEVREALAHPGAPLRRPVGGTGAFRLEPAAREIPKRAPAKAPKPGKPPPDRTRFTAAEARLAEMKLQSEAEQRDLRETWSQRLADQREVVEAARTAFRAAR